MNMRGKNRINRAFTGIPTFLRSNLAVDLDELNAEFAIFGVPMDDGSPYMPGTRFGPRTIREHSMRFSPTGFYDLERKKHYLSNEVIDGRIVDAGDVDIAPTNIEKTLDNITGFVETLLRQKVTPVGIGGDHSVTYPILRAFKENIHVVQFDAHLDYAPITEDLKYTNGHPFRQAGRLKNIESITQVGVRSLRTRESDFHDAQKDGNKVITMGSLRSMGAASVANLLPQRSKCYVSIDIDALDMSLIPGCVSAEPGGMYYEELRDALIGLAENHDIVGFDLVEVNPQLDVGTEVTSYLAAHIMVEFLGHICANRELV